MGLEAAVLGMTVISGIMQAMGSIQKGSSMQRAEEYNATVARQQAAAIRTSADLDIYRQKREARAMKSKQEALYSKAGVQLSGSPLEVMVDTAANYNLDQMITDYNAKVGISRAENEAQYDTYLGQTYANEGLAKAGRTLLATGSSIAMLGASKKAPANTKSTKFQTWEV